MSKYPAIIKDLIKILDEAQRTPATKELFDNDIEKYLEEHGIDKKTILEVADTIGISLPITLENADHMEWFADFIKTYLYEFVRSIRIYLEIIKVAAYKSTVYRTLLNIYLYDIDAVSNFDFTENAIHNFSMPAEGVDPHFFCMSYTYIGMLYQRLGRFWDARAVFNMAMSFRNDPRQITKTAEYGNLELDYLASVINTDHFADYRKALSTNPKPKLLIGTVFFGARYGQVFQNAAGRTFFCKANVCALKEKWDPCVIVFCTLFDRMRLESSAIYQEISDVMPVNIVILPEWLISAYPDPPPPGRDIHPALPYSLSGLAQTCLLTVARQIDASLITLPADAIFSDTTVSEITRAADEGYQVVFTPGIRLTSDNVLQRLVELSEKEEAATLGISPAMLTRIALNNLHPATQAMFGTNSRVTHPGMVWWPVKDKGLFGHCFQMHPIFIKNDLIKRTPIRRFDSIDGDFVYAMLPATADWNRIHVITEPDRVIMFELSGPSVPVEIKYDTTNLARSAGIWIAGVMRPLSFWLLEKRVVFGEMSATRDKALLAHADTTIADLARLGRNLPFKTLRCSADQLKKTDAGLETLVRDWLIRGSSRIPLSPLVPTRMGSDPTTLRVIYSLAVWGKRYIENFLNICLPSMLADGNLGNMPNNRHSLFLLYTQKEDMPLFETNAQYQRLREMIPLEIVPLEPQLFSNKYSVLNSTQSNTVQRSHGFDVVCFLYSDFLWARGGIRFSLQKIAEGYDGVVSPVPPLVMERFLDMLSARFSEFVHFLKGRTGAFDISVSSRTLIKYAKSILHPMMRDNVVDYKVNTSSPAYVLWLGPGNDLLIRCFHAHPVALKVKSHTPEYWVPFDQTLDEWFLPRAFPATDRLYFVRDSDELAIISLTEEDFPTPYIGDHHHLDAAFIAQWAESCAAPMHKIMFNYYTLWHEHELDQVNWQPVIDRSETTAQEIRLRLSMPDTVQHSETPQAHLARIDRARRYRNMGPTGAAALPPVLATKKSAMPIRYQVLPWVLNPICRILERFPSGTKRRLYLSLPSHRLRTWSLNLYYKSKEGFPQNGLPDKPPAKKLSKVLGVFAHYLRSLLAIKVFR